MIAAMLAPLGTLAFLGTLWLLVVLGAAVLEESGAKVAAALKGTHRVQRGVAGMALRFHTRPWVGRPMRAQPQWRAAA
jgi:hypothetical protein